MAKYCYCVIAYKLLVDQIFAMFRLVLESDIAEKVAHWFFVVNATNRLGNENRNVNCYNFVAAALLNFMWYWKREENLLDKESHIKNK